jgi:PhzF family phenazine biosynthesis protein
VTATYRFKQVDVFTSQPLRGNPVAVVLGADHLGADEMQRIASWTNLSETTFVLAPTIAEPAYRLRIFTPQHELPFAGHPTIGSCHAVLEAGVVTARDGRLVQECGAGNLPLRVEGEGASRRIAVEAPEARFAGDHATLAGRLSAALGRGMSTATSPAAYCNGPTWLFVRYDDAADVASIAPDMAALAGLSREHAMTGVVAFALVSGQAHAVHVRCFAPAVGVPEDPVTGSANAALPAYLSSCGLLEHTGREYVAVQGGEMGRDGRVFVRVLDDRGRAEIGGHAVTVVDGEISF